MRVFKRIANPGLGSQIDHNIKLALGKKVLQLFALGQIHLCKCKIGFFLQAFEPGLFKRNIIIRI